MVRKWNAVTHRHTDRHTDRQTDRTIPSVNIFSNEMTEYKKPRKKYVGTHIMWCRDCCYAGVARYGEVATAVKNYTIKMLARNFSTAVTLTFRDRCRDREGSLVYNVMSRLSSRRCVTTLSCRVRLSRQLSRRNETNACTQLIDSTRTKCVWS